MELFLRPVDRTPRRYDHTCPCTAVSGHGRITDATPGCPDPTCAGSVDYAVCPTCRTRVTLANLWQVQRGGAGPDDFLVPHLDLVVEDEQGPIKRARHLLMHLPLPSACGNGMASSSSTHPPSSGRVRARSCGTGGPRETVSSA